MTAPDLAHLAGLLADRTRAAICLPLLDGRAWTAGELAGHAWVAPATATEHRTLLDRVWVQRIASGRAVLLTRPVRGRSPGCSGPTPSGPRRPDVG